MKLRRTTLGRRQPELIQEASDLFWRTSADSTYCFNLADLISAVGGRNFVRVCLALLGGGYSW